ncbi:hypothetical protein HK097_009735 [Rhizophlyctis rosea]|uniref:CUE domain-containing protein n=1 Tax=Rhizophlyctis rosea TaxID=64517 RepID=A0AAD5S8H3_9FUNG|nr:hypothetical protein HK097_009735 [Rhizophlyctis rosea]
MQPPAPTSASTSTAPSKKTKPKKLLLGDDDSMGERTSVKAARSALKARENELANANRRLASLEQTCGHLETRAEKAEKTAQILTDELSSAQLIMEKLTESAKSAAEIAHRRVSDSIGNRMDSERKVRQLEGRIKTASTAPRTPASTSNTAANNATKRLATNKPKGPWSDNKDLTAVPPVPFSKNHTNPPDHNPPNTPSQPIRGFEYDLNSHTSPEVERARQAAVTALPAEPFKFMPGRHTASPPPSHPSTSIRTPIINGEDVRQLVSMFPTLQFKVIDAALRSHDGCVEDAAETLLVEVEKEEEREWEKDIKVLMGWFPEQPREYIKRMCIRHRGAVSASFAIRAEVDSQVHFTICDCSLCVSDDTDIPPISFQDAVLFEVADTPLPMLQHK